jgi:hypothetical protein
MIASCRPTVPAKKPKQASSLSAFISHAKGDAKKAQEIAASLEERGLKCWIAPRDVRAGRSYGDEIITGIENSRSFVLVLSRASNDSAFVAREVEHAVSKKKPIFASASQTSSPRRRLSFSSPAPNGSMPFRGGLAPISIAWQTCSPRKRGQGRASLRPTKGTLSRKRPRDGYGRRARQQPFFLPLARGWFSGLPTTGHRSALTARIPSL